MEIMANDLNRFGQDIEDYASAYQSFVNNLDMLITHMKDLDTMWEGEAHEQLKVTFGSDVKKVKETVDLLGELKENLDYAYTEYNKCEKTVSTIIDSINV